MKKSLLAGTAWALFLACAGPAEAAMQKATFAAGCFWGVEAAFSETPGVVSATSGYTGGHAKNPTYEQVCTDTTGHAEAVEVVYDPARVSYEQLLRVFWEIHDPTTRDRQGPDVGSQYHSAIFTHSPEQHKAAQESKARLDKARLFMAPVVTEIVAATEFYPAEAYHQKYLARRGVGCHVRRRLPDF